MARASILWLIGEYCEHVPKIAPDVLRKMAKSFTNEEDIVKLQIINLAAKLYLTNSKQVGMACFSVTSIYGCPFVLSPFPHPQIGHNNTTNGCPALSLVLLQVSPC